MTKPNSAPASVANGEDMLAIRDQLRDGLGLHGIEVAVRLGTIGLHRRIVVPPLSLTEAQKLTEALGQAAEPTSSELPQE
jgi:hypothetical protein